MVKLSQAALLLVVVALSGSANAFAPSPLCLAQRTALFLSGEVADAPVEKEGAPALSRPSSGMKVSAFRKSIASLTAENFSRTLSDIEPFFLNDAGSTMYAKSMSRITTRAKMVGVTVPEGYAKDAAATEKRRVKQDAFIKVKDEERMAAEAEVAEAAAAAAAEPAKEEAEVVEEATKEEPAAEPVEA
jgi:hypothetical protein